MKKTFRGLQDNEIILVISDISGYGHATRSLIKRSPSKNVGRNSEANAERSPRRSRLAVDGPHAHHSGEDKGHHHFC